MPEPTPKLRIAETFASIQGEGIYVGVPSTFIRVSGCNLRCGWCDTPYASWNPEGEFFTVEELADKATDFGVGHVVVTGGEPMLFEPVEALTRLLARRGHTITIETAGTVYREVDCDLMSISPKLQNSLPPADSGWRDRHDRARLDIDVLRRLIRTYPYQLKFVLDPEAGDDVSEIDSILSRLPDVQPQRVLLMPEGTDSETLLRRSRLLVGLCMARNWRLTPRMHVDLFGNTKGT
ncbi:MAG TPA: 7-carboxy-7-deazaguanine synthase QueE [Fimbriimonas sp.]